MFKYPSIIALLSLMISALSFADATDTTRPAPMDDDKQCEMIVTACQHAGFTRSGGPGKAFWHNCMKPILLGQIVFGVTVDQKDILACRQSKIMKMQKELDEFKRPLPPPMPPK